jgi:hypothetical protein
MFEEKSLVQPDLKASDRIFAIDSMEAAPIPSDLEYEILALDLMSRFCDDAISR